MASSGWDLEDGWQADGSYYSDGCYYSRDEGVTMEIMAKLPFKCRPSITTMSTEVYNIEDGVTSVDVNLKLGKCVHEDDVNPIYEFDPDSHDNIKRHYEVLRAEGIIAKGCYVQRDTFSGNNGGGSQTFSTYFVLKTSHVNLERVSDLLTH